MKYLQWSQTVRASWCVLSNTAHAAVHICLRCPLSKKTEDEQKFILSHIRGPGATEGFLQSNLGPVLSMSCGRTDEWKKCNFLSNTGLLLFVTAFVLASTLTAPRNLLCLHAAPLSSGSYTYFYCVQST